MDGWILVMAAALIIAYARARRRRLRALRTQVNRPLSEDLRPSGNPSLPEQTPSGTGFDLAAAVEQRGHIDASVLSALTGASFLWQWVTIEPQVIAAADFASVADISSGLDFVRHIGATSAALPEASQAAYLSRLQGYVGEQQVAERLTDAGHTVVEATTANNPDWDFIVDGLYYNPKAVAHIANADLIHDDVTYVIPEDTAGTVTLDNVERLDGWSYAELQESVEGAVKSATGEATLEALSQHLPLATFALVASREFEAVRNGKTLPAAAEHSVLEVASKSAAAVAGLELGGTIGMAAAGPPGAAAGAVLGAGASVLAVSPLVGRAKGWRLRRANTQLEVALSAYGAAATPSGGRLTAVAHRPLEAAETPLAALTEQFSAVRRSMRWKLWPSYGQVALEQAVSLGARRRDDLARRTARTIGLIEQAEQGEPAALGAALLAVPELADEVIADAPAHRENVTLRANRVRVERANLAAGKRRPSESEPTPD